jgi:hypothetical protein
MLIYIKAENKFLQLLSCPTSAAMDCVFHVYMQQEDKAMVMTLYDSSETINTTI